jgi:hypothetical protein
MKVLGLLMFFILINVDNLKAQINLDIFIKSVVEETKTIEKKRNFDINNFMKYGYKKRSELRNDSICKIPIYTIFINNKFINHNRSKDSLFVYLNPKSLCLDHIFFYIDSSIFIAVAYPEYINIKDQPIGLGNIQDAKLADIAIKVKPDILFSLSQSDKIYFSLKNNIFFCYVYDEKRGNFIQVTPKELLKIIDESEFYFMTNLDSPIPLTYSK